MSATDTNNDFDFYLKFAKPLVLNLAEPNGNADRVLAASWIKKLRDENSGTDKLRTDYLKLLLFVLQRNRLVGPFAEHPGEDYKLEEFTPSHKLQDVAKALIEADEAERREKFQKGVGGASGDVPPYSVEYSADLLEYAAAQDIPNFGVHAYYAISKEPLQHWDNSDKATFPKIAETPALQTSIVSRVSVSASAPVLRPGSPLTGSPRAGPSTCPSRARSRSRSPQPLSRSRSRSPGEGVSEYAEHERFDFSGKQANLVVEAASDVASPRRTSRPSSPLGSAPPSDDRTPPTWGSNLITVTDPPVYKDDVGATLYSPLLPTGESDPFFMEEEPSFVDISFADSSVLSRDASPQRTPLGAHASSRLRTSPRPGISQPGVTFAASSYETPPRISSSRYRKSPASIETLSYRTPSPKPRRGQFTPEQVTPLVHSLSAHSSVGRREQEYDIEDLQQYGVDEALLETDVFNMDDVKELRVSDMSVESIEEDKFEKTQYDEIDADLDAFDKMLTEFEKDHYPVDLSPKKSPARSPVKASPQKSKLGKMKKPATSKKFSKLRGTKTTAGPSKTPKTTVLTTTVSDTRVVETSTAGPSDIQRTRIPQPGGSGIARPAGTGIPRPRGTGISRPGSTEMLRPGVRPVSPYEEAPSLPYLTPPLDVSIASGSSRYPSLPYRTPSPELVLDHEQLKQFGLTEADVDDSVFNLGNIADVRLSDISVDSDFQYEGEEFNGEDEEMAEALENWERRIAELEAEHAEDIEMYGDFNLSGSPQERATARLRSSPRPPELDAFTLADQYASLADSPRRRIASSPRSPSTPPRPLPPVEFYSPQESPGQYIELVKQHVYTDHYYDEDRELMNKYLRIKGKDVPLRGAARPRLLPIIEHGDVNFPGSTQVTIATPSRSPRQSVLDAVTLADQQYAALADTPPRRIPSPPRSPRRSPVSGPLITVPTMQPGSPRAQEIIDTATVRLSSPRTYTAEALVDEQGMTRTPAVFSRDVEVREGADRVYQPEEFELSGDEFWVPGSEFFAGKTAFSPWQDHRERKPLRDVFPEIEILPGEERFFEKQDEPDFFVMDDSVGSEHMSPSKRQMQERIRDVMSELSRMEEDTPAMAGVPVTTPRRSHSPRRPYSPLHFETPPKLGTPKSFYESPLPSVSQRDLSTILHVADQQCADLVDASPQSELSPLSRAIRAAEQLLIGTPVRQQRTPIRSPEDPFGLPRPTHLSATTVDVEDLKPKTPARSPVRNPTVVPPTREAVLAEVERQYDLIMTQSPGSVPDTEQVQIAEQEQRIVSVSGLDDIDVEVTPPTLVPDDWAPTWTYQTPPREEQKMIPESKATVFIPEKMDEYIGYEFAPEFYQSPLGSPPAPPSPLLYDSPVTPEFVDPFEISANIEEDALNLSIPIQDIVAAHEYTKAFVDSRKEQSERRAQVGGSRRIIRKKMSRSPRGIEAISEDTPSLLLPSPVKLDFKPVNLDSLTRIIEHPQRSESPVEREIKREEEFFINEYIDPRRQTLVKRVSRLITDVPDSTPPPQTTSQRVRSLTSPPTPPGIFDITPPDAVETETIPDAYSPPPLSPKSEAERQYASLFSSSPTRKAVRRKKKKTVQEDAVGDWIRQIREEFYRSIAKRRRENRERDITPLAQQIEVEQPTFADMQQMEVEQPEVQGLPDFPTTPPRPRRIRHPDSPPTPPGLFDVTPPELGSESPVAGYISPPYFAARSPPKSPPAPLSPPIVDTELANQIRMADVPPYLRRDMIIMPSPNRPFRLQRHSVGPQLAKLREAPDDYDEEHIPFRENVESYSGRITRRNIVDSKKRIYERHAPASSLQAWQEVQNEIDVTPPEPPPPPPPLPPWALQPPRQPRRIPPPGIPRPRGTGIPRKGGTGIPRPGGTGIPRHGGTRIPRSGGTGIPRPGGTGIARPDGTGIPRPGGTGIPRPGDANIPRSADVSIPRPGTTVPTYSYLTPAIQSRVHTRGYHQSYRMPSKSVRRKLDFDEPELEEEEDLTGYGKMIRNLEQKYIALPELPPSSSRLPEDLMFVGASTSWDVPETEMDAIIPSGLPSPLKTHADELNWWKTPPHLKKKTKTPPQFEFKLHPTLRDYVLLEHMPSEFASPTRILPDGYFPLSTELPDFGEWSSYSESSPYESPPSAPTLSSPIPGPSWRITPPPFAHAQQSLISQREASTLSPPRPLTPVRFDSSQESTPSRQLSSVGFGSPQESPGQYIESVNQHEYTDHYYDQERKLMNKFLRIKGKAIRLRDAASPHLPSIIESSAYCSPTLSSTVAGPSSRITPPKPLKRIPEAEKAMSELLAFAQKTYSPSEESEDTAFTPTLVREPSRTPSPRTPVRLPPPTTLWDRYEAVDLLSEMPSDVLLPESPSRRRAREASKRQETVVEKKEVTYDFGLPSPERIPSPKAQHFRTRIVEDDVVLSPPSRKVMEQVSQRPLLERVEESVADIPVQDVPMTSIFPPYKLKEFASPEWSPTLPKAPKRVSDDLEYEGQPYEVRIYNSPPPHRVERTPPQRVTRTPPGTPPRTSVKSPLPDIFNIEGVDEIMEEVISEDIIIPTSPPRSPLPSTPPRPPSPIEFDSPQESPGEYIELVKQHEYTDRYYDQDRQLMNKYLRIKGKAVPLRGAARPRLLPIIESIREPISPEPRSPREVREAVLVPITPPTPLPEARLAAKHAMALADAQYASLAESSPPISESTQNMIRDVELPEHELTFPILDRFDTDYENLPPALLDPGLRFHSPPPPSPPSPRIPYVPITSYRDLAYSTPPRLFGSPTEEQDIFDTVLEEEEDRLDLTPTGIMSELQFETPERSFGSPQTPSPFLGYTPPPRSPIDSPSFRRDIVLHEYTDHFYDQDRELANKIIKSGSKVFRLQRSSEGPPLDYIAEEIETIDSPTYPRRYSVYSPTSAEREYYTPPRLLSTPNSAERQYYTPPRPEPRTPTSAERRYYTASTTTPRRSHRPRMSPKELFSPPRYIPPLRRQVSSSRRLRTPESEDTVEEEIDTGQSDVWALGEFEYEIEDPFGGNTSPGISDIHREDSFFEEDMADFNWMG